MVREGGVWVSDRRWGGGGCVCYLRERGVCVCYLRERWFIQVQLQPLDHIREVSSVEADHVFGHTRRLRPTQTQTHPKTAQISIRHTDRA